MIAPSFLFSYPLKRFWLIVSAARLAKGGAAAAVNLQSAFTPGIPLFK
jgi:hypothetical protein